MKKTLALVAALPLGLLGCGTQTVADEPKSMPVVSRPTAVPVPDGQVRATTVTVLDDGGGPELCLGGVADSLPPQCGGPIIEGWDWATLGGRFEEARGVRWGTFSVTGTYDGTTFTLTEPPARPIEPAETKIESARVCMPPKAGWEVPAPDRATYDDFNAGVEAASGLPDLGGVSVDQSGLGLSPEEIDLALADGDESMVATWLIKVSVTEDLDRAERVVREHWGGPLCVTRADRTEQELMRIGRAAAEDVPGLLSWGISRGHVGVGVTFDDGSIQRWLDQEYGDGVVVIESSALEPVQ